MYMVGAKYLMEEHMIIESRDSSVGMALGYGLEIFLFTTASRLSLGPTQRPI